MILLPPKPACPTESSALARAANEDIVSGFDNFPETLLKLLSGENTGKLVLKAADE